MEGLYRGLRADSGLWEQRWSRVQGEPELPPCILQGRGRGGCLRTGCKLFWFHVQVAACQSPRPHHTPTDRPVHLLALFPTGGHMHLISHTLRDPLPWSPLSPHQPVGSSSPGPHVDPDLTAPPTHLVTRI